MNTNNTYDWITNPHRTETFVLKFKDQESFEKFWNKYINDANGINEGISYKSISRGDRISLLDECQELLYEAAEKIKDVNLQERMYKLSEQ